MPEFESELKFMSVLCEASFLVRQIAAPESGKSALLLAYRKLGSWTYNRVKDVYYADCRVRISGEEIDHLRAVARARKAEGKASDPSIVELREQLALVAAHLHRIDPSFHHPSIEALRLASHTGGGTENRSGGTDGVEE